MDSEDERRRRMSVHQSRRSSSHACRLRGPCSSRTARTDCGPAKGAVIRCRAYKGVFRRSASTPSCKSRTLLVRDDQVATDVHAGAGPPAIPRLPRFERPVDE